MQLSEATSYFLYLTYTQRDSNITYYYRLQICTSLNRVNGPCYYTFIIDNNK